MRYRGVNSRILGSKNENSRILGSKNENSRKQTDWRRRTFFSCCVLLGLRSFLNVQILLREWTLSLVPWETENHECRCNCKSRILGSKNEISRILGIKYEKSRILEVFKFSESRNKKRKFSDSRKQKWRFSESRKPISPTLKCLLCNNCGYLYFRDLSLIFAYLEERNVKG